MSARKKAKEILRARWDKQAASHSPKAFALAAPTAGPSNEGGEANSLPKPVKKPSLAVRKRAAEILRARWDKRASQAKTKPTGK